MVDKREEGREMKEHSKTRENHHQRSETTMKKGKLAKPNTRKQSGDTRNEGGEKRERREKRGRRRREGNIGEQLEAMRDGTTTEEI